MIGQHVSVARGDIESEYPETLPLFCAIPEGRRVYLAMMPSHFVRLCQVYPSTFSLDDMRQYGEFLRRFRLDALDTVLALAPRTLSAKLYIEAALASRS